MSSAPPAASSGRREELAGALARVHHRIDAACASAGRTRDEVCLVVVTKTFPASDVRLLAGLGVRDVGESRDQEAAPKAAAGADLDLAWHFVGRLQSNKARSVASYAFAVHSVDRLSLVTALASGARQADRTVGVLVQVSLDDDPDRGGAHIEDVPGLAEAVGRAPGLELRGVMGVAPLGVEPAEAFERLVAVAARVRSDHPEATWISAGMSGDLEAAVGAGATHLRVGSAVLGSRPPLG